MKKKISIFIICLAIPFAVIGGGILFKERHYAWLSLCLTMLSCIPFFLDFEKKEADTKKLILIAVMIALSVIGRIIFTPLPSFKPVTATVIITALYFGKEAGFMTGALSAVLSNFYFGQGPWTPFQMLSWGIIGFIAGALSRLLKRNKAVLLFYGIISGVLYSMLMDIWTVLWADGFFNPSRYIAAIISAAPFTLIYAVSNVVFLLFFAKPIGKIFDRIKTKYAI